MWGIEPQTSTKRNIVLYQLSYIPNFYYNFVTINFNILVIINQIKIKKVIRLEKWGIEPQTSTKHNIVLYQLIYIPNFNFDFHYK